MSSSVSPNAVQAPDIPEGIRQSAVNEVFTIRQAVDQGEPHLRTVLTMAIDIHAELIGAEGNADLRMLGDEFALLRDLSEQPDLDVGAILSSTSRVYGLCMRHVIQEDYAVA